MWKGSSLTPRIGVKAILGMKRRKLSMTQTIGKISGKGEDLSVIIPRKDRKLFKRGDHVIIIKAEFVPASELVKKEG